MRPVYSPTAMGEIEEPHRITLTGAIALRLLVPAVIGGATGAFVAVASWLTEDRALGALASPPGAGPALFSPLALLATLAVVRWVTRTAKPSTAELYIVTYHAPGARLPLRQIPGRVLDAMAGARHLVVLETAPVVDATFIAGVVLVGVACGLGARLFARVGEVLKRLARR